MFVQRSALKVVVWQHILKTMTLPPTLLNRPCPYGLAPSYRCETLKTLTGIGFDLAPI